MLLGNVMALVLTVCGGLAGYSDLLSYDPHLAAFARAIVLPFGLTATVLHAQMLWERAKSGNVIADHRHLYVCTASQILVLVFLIPWLLQLKESLIDPQMQPAFPVMVLSGWAGIACILSIMLIRLLVLCQSGCKRKQFDDKYFLPRLNPANMVALEEEEEHKGEKEGDGSPTEPDTHHQNVTVAARSFGSNPARVAPAAL
eukprot:g11758.t1